MRLRFAVLSLLAFASARCSAPSNGDASTDHASDSTADTRTVCTADLECDDHTFCNGVERCMPGAISANAHGCIPGTTPCPAPTTCDEANTRCVNSCVDADHDGHGAMSCGGDDCDDNDANRFPGNPEVCAWDSTRNMRVDPTHDEDCDSSTVANRASGDGDHDNDSYIDVRCCNATASGMHCGDDCADTAQVDGVPAVFGTHIDPANIHPTLPEICNGVDDNCDSHVDEGLTIDGYFPDCDGDHFGASTGMATMACGPAGVDRCMGQLAAANNGDCNDAEPAIHAGATEACNEIDDDCDGMVDDGIPTTAYYRDCDGDGFGDSTSPAASACGPLPSLACNGHDALTDHSDCNDTNAAVNITATEVCNAIDDDCDGQTDEGLGSMTLHPDCDGDGYGDSNAARTITGCGAGGVPPCNGHLAVSDARDCRDDLDAVHPGITTYSNTRACPTGMSSCTWSELRINSSGTGTVTTMHSNMCVPSGTCPTMQCGITGTACPPSIGPQSTWDYDCSGAGEREPLTTPNCPLATFGGGPRCPPYTYPMTMTMVPGSGTTDAATHGAPATMESDCGALQVQTWTCAYVAPSAMNPSPHCDINYSAARGIACR